MVEKKKADKAECKPRDARFTERDEGGAVDVYDYLTDCDTVRYFMVNEEGERVGSTQPGAVASETIHMADFVIDVDTEYGLVASVGECTYEYRLCDFRRELLK